MPKGGRLFGCIGKIVWRMCKQSIRHLKLSTEILKGLGLCTNTGFQNTAVVVHIQQDFHYFDRLRTLQFGFE